MNNWLGKADEPKLRKESLYFSEHSYWNRLRSALADTICERGHTRPFRFVNTLHGRGKPSNLGPSGGRAGVSSDQLFLLFRHKKFEVPQRPNLAARRREVLRQYIEQADSRGMERDNAISLLRKNGWKQSEIKKRQLVVIVWAEKRITTSRHC